MTTSVIATAPVDELAAALRGDLILPADPGTWPGTSPVTPAAPTRGG